jgi:hypothetical protein
MEMAGSLFMPLLNPLLLGSLAQWRAIAATKVAAAMLAAARSQRRGIHVYEGQALRALADSGRRRTS